MNIEPPRFARFACSIGAACAAIVAVAIAVTGSVRPIAGNQSLASGGALFVAALAALTLFTAAWAPQSVWIGANTYWIRWCSISPDCGTGKSFCCVLGLAICCQSILSIRIAARNERAIDDQADYLRVARDVASSGGSLGLPVALWSGRFVEDNRHPLYVAIIADRPEIGFAKAVSITFGLLATMAAAGIAARGFGWAAGAATAAVLSVNAALLQSSTLVACETLLTFLIALGFGLIMAQRPVTQVQSAGLRVCEMRPSLADRGRTIFCVAAVGVLFGLAYLTKASAFFLFVLTLAALLLEYRLSWCRRFALAVCLVASFTATAAPLLVRNCRIYGDPLHSYNNRMLFADSFENGAASEDLGLIGNWRRFANDHSVHDVATRLGRGVLTETFVVLRAAGPVPLDSGRALFGFVIAIFACLGPAVDREQRWSAMLLTTWIAVFIVFFGWYQPIASGDRFVLPLAPPLAVFAAAGFCRLTGSLLSEPWRGRAAMTIAAAYCLTFFLLAYSAWIR